jgi:ribosomal protein L22
MSEKKKSIMPTHKEMEREAKRLKKEEKRQKSGKKLKEVVFGPGSTAKQKKKADKALKKIIKDNLKEMDIDDLYIKH